MLNESSNPKEYFKLFINDFINHVTDTYLGNIDYDKLLLSVLSTICDSLDVYSHAINLDNPANLAKPSKTDIISDEFGSIIKLRAISKESYQDLCQFISKINSDENKFIVLDLRENEGGDVVSLLQICSLFVSSKKLFYSIDKSRNTENYSTFKSLRLLNPVIVIVGKQTKSAAELLAQVMKENNYLIIGEKTFGKGKAQISQKYGNIKTSFTNKEFFSYSCGQIDGVGVTPCKEVDFSTYTDGDILQYVSRLL